MVRFVTACAALFAAPSVAASATECATADLGDPVSMMQIERIHVSLRQLFLDKQIPDEVEAPVETEAEEPSEESAEAPAEESAAAPAEEVAAAPVGGSGESPAEESAEAAAEATAMSPVGESAAAPAEESAEAPAQASAAASADEISEQSAEESVEESVEVSAEESAESPARESLDDETPAEGEAEPPHELVANAEAHTEAEGETEVRPFLPSDYANDGDNGNYLQDMEERVAADAAAQPAMVSGATPSSGDSSDAPSVLSDDERDGSLSSFGEDESNGNAAGAVVDDSGSESDAPAEESAAAPAEEFAETSPDSGIDAPADASGDSSTDTTNDGKLANAVAAPIVSLLNSSFNDFGTNLYVMRNMSGLAGFGTPLEPVNAFDGNFVVDSNDPMGWRDYRPTDSPWPFDTPRNDTAAELSSSASDVSDDDFWANYVHDDNNELDERDPDEIYESLKHPLWLHIGAEH